MSDSVTKWYEMQDDSMWSSNDTYSTKTPKTDPIVEDVIKKMRSRSEEGIKKYGTTLKDSPDGFYAWLNHAQEEAMDWILYLEKIKQQK